MSAEGLRDEGGAGPEFSTWTQPEVQLRLPRFFIYKLFTSLLHRGTIGGPTPSHLISPLDLAVASVPKGTGLGSAMETISPEVVTYHSPAEQNGLCDTSFKLRGGLQAHLEFLSCFDFDPLASP